MSGTSLKAASEFRLFVLLPPDMARIALAAPSDAIPVRSLNFPTYQARLYNSLFGRCKMPAVPGIGLSGRLEELSPEIVRDSPIVAISYPVTTSRSLLSLEQSKVSSIIA